MKLLTFVGHGHTGHTILAAILDSHPHVAMANTYGKLETIEDAEDLSPDVPWDTLTTDDLEAFGELLDT